MKQIFKKTIIVCLFVLTACSGKKELPNSVSHKPKCYYVIIEEKKWTFWGFSTPRTESFSIVETKEPLFEEDEDSTIYFWLGKVQKVTDGETELFPKHDYVGFVWKEGGLNEIHRFYKDIKNPSRYASSEKIIYSRMKDGEFIYCEKETETKEFKID